MTIAPLKTVNEPHCGERKVTHTSFNRTRKLRSTVFKYTFRADCGIFLFMIINESHQEAVLHSANTGVSCLSTGSCGRDGRCTRLPSLWGIRRPVTPPHSARWDELTPDIPEPAAAFNLLSLHICCCRVSVAGETTARRWCSSWESRLIRHSITAVWTSGTSPKAPRSPPHTPETSTAPKPLLQYGQRFKRSWNTSLLQLCIQTEPLSCMITAPCPVSSENQEPDSEPWRSGDERSDQSSWRHTFRELVSWWCSDRRSVWAGFRPAHGLAPTRHPHRWVVQLQLQRRLEERPTFYAFIVHFERSAKLVHSLSIYMIQVPMNELLL